MSRYPLRIQLMLPLVGVAVASLLAVAVLGSWLAAKQTRGRIEAQLKGVAGVLTTSNFPLTQPVLEKMRDLAGAEFAVTDHAGHVTVSSLTGDVASLPVDQVVSSVESVDLDRAITVAGRRYFHSSLAHRNRRDLNRPAVLHILFPCDQYRAAWRAAILPPLAVGVVAVIAVAAVTHGVAARIGRVTRQLGDDVRRLAEGDFAPVELPARDDEVRDLAVAVNQTAARLVDYEDQVRRTEQLRTVALLGAGLAHEIRNAATGCRMAVDLHAEACPELRDDESLAVAKRQLVLMENRLQRFLQLGKQPAAIDRQPLDLGQLVGDLMKLVEPMARHADVALDWQSPADPLTVPADAEALSQAIINLALNAVEAAQKRDAHAHSHSEQHVSLRVTRAADNRAEIEVRDSGDGPGGPLAESLFDPFVTSKAEGVGLGLAVARQVVDAHGGTIDWSRSDGHTTFRIRLPLTAAEPILQH